MLRAVTWHIETTAQEVSAHPKPTTLISSLSLTLLEAFE